MTTSVQNTAGVLHEVQGRFSRALQRIVAGVKLIHEVFTEAQAMARAAHRARPFIDWS